MSASTDSRSSVVRNKIWKFAAHEPRDVEVIGPYELGTRWENRTGGLNNKPPTRFQCSTAVPAMLHACREARDEGLKYYSTWFKLGDRTYKDSFHIHNLGEVIWHHKIEGAEDRSIYVNIEVDTLFVRVPFARYRWYKELQYSLTSQMSTCVPSWSPPPCQMAVITVGKSRMKPGTKSSARVEGEIICVIKKAFKPDNGKEAAHQQTGGILQRLKAAVRPGKGRLMLEMNTHHFAWDVVLWDEIWTALFEAASNHYKIKQRLVLVRR